jgi:hypothetical protein
MAVNIKLKRSAVPGNIPTTSSLELGELALNTYDGKVFLKKQVGSVQTVVELISSGGTISSASYADYAAVAGYALTANVANTALNANNATSASYSAYTSNASSASYAVTASYVLNTGNVSTASYAISASYATTASYAANIPLTASWATNAVTASYVSASAVVGLNLFRIVTGSITASVDINPNNLFLIQSGSTPYLNIASRGNTTINSDLFIIKNFTTQQPILTISQSIIQFATHSSNPVEPTEAGSVWFTSTAMYIGLE